MKRATLFGIVTSLFMGINLSMGVRAQETPANQVLKFSFEKDVQKWQAIGTDLTTATLAHATDPAHVHGGSGALQYNYKIHEGEKSGAFGAILVGKLAKMKTLRIWVQPDHNTVIGVILQERDGGRYMGFAYVNADKWNEMRFAVEDFILSTNPGDPKDPDGKLDIEQVDSIAVTDYSQWLAGGGKGELQEKLFPYRRGDHVMYLDDVEALTDVQPELTPKKGEDTVVDSLERPQPSWVPLGSVKMLSIEESKPLKGKSLKIEYKVTPDMFGAVTKNLTRPLFTQNDKIGFSVASLKPIRLLVQVEDRQGGRYNTTLNLLGDSDPREVIIAWKELSIAPDSKTKVSLDPAKIVRLFFMDITGAIDTVTQENTLWINSLRSVH